MPTWRAISWAAARCPCVRVCGGVGERGCYDGLQRLSAMLCGPAAVALVCSVPFFMVCAVPVVLPASMALSLPHPSEHTC